MDLRTWLDDQGLSVRELALELDVPLKTAQDWVYRGVASSGENAAKTTEYIVANCAHHWVIEAPNGPVSQGVCKRCGDGRGVDNSMYGTAWKPPKAKRPAK